MDRPDPADLDLDEHDVSGDLRALCAVLSDLRDRGGGDRLLADHAIALAASAAVAGGLVTVADLPADVTDLLHAAAGELRPHELGLLTAH